jgi:hypothetical protein
MFGTISDEAFLARTKRNYESRRKTGAIALLFGLALLVGAAWGFGFASETARNFKAALTNVSTDPATAVDMSTFFLGLKLGGALTVLTITAAHLLSYGFSLLCGQRKERMLLELSRKEQAAKHGKLA